MYEAMLPLCYENEKPDAYYRLGFCHLFMENWVGAWNEFLKAQDAYQNIGTHPTCRPVSYRSATCWMD